MRKKIIWSASLLVVGVVCMVIASSGEASHAHYQLNDFYQRLEANPSNIQGRYMTVYGNVKEGSIQKSGIQAHFTIEKDDLLLKVFFTGKNLLPDTFKDGSQAAVEGIFDVQKQIFIADKVMAKCASRYKAYPNNDLPG